jgi:hypothetical protein
VKLDDRSSFLGQQPMVAWDRAVVLVRLAVALSPLEELASRQLGPSDEALDWKLSLSGPEVDEVDDRVAEIGGSPAAF